MLRYALLLSVVVVCFAQPTPTRPVIPETFSSTGTLEVHGAHPVELEGTFIIDRDQAKNMGVENATFKEGSTIIHYELLELYNIGSRYTERILGTEEPHCQIEKVSGNMPAFWGWVAQANFTGTEKYHEITYDVWDYSTGGTELTLLVTQDDTKTPKLFRRKAGLEEYIFIFASFSAVEPPAIDFIVPFACKTAEMKQSSFYRFKSSF